MEQYHAGGIGIAAVNVVEPYPVALDELSSGGFLFSAKYETKTLAADKTSKIMTMIANTVSAVDIH